MGWSLNFGEDNIETIDTAGRLPEGWYKATLAKVEDDQEDGGTKFTFRTPAGAITHKLRNPQFANSPEAGRVSVNQAKNWASRLGLISKEDMGKQKDIVWANATGREVVIHVTKRSYAEKVDGKTTGVMKDITEVAFAGVYPCDHPDIPADVRATLQLGEARAREGRATSAGKSAAAAAAGTTATSAAAPAVPAVSNADLAKSLFGG